MKIGYMGNEISMKNIYKNGRYFDKNPTWHTEDSPWKAKQILYCLNRNHIRPDSVCEVGCGAGEILNQLHRQMAGDVLFHGYEISPQAYQLCKGRAKERLEFFFKDILEADSRVYDLVLIIDVFEHIEDYFSFLKKAKGKGTYKMFHIPLDLSVQTVLRAHMIKGRKEYGHLHYFTKETALATLKDTGYTILDWFYTPEQLKLPNRSLKASLMNIPRRLFFNLNQDLTVRIFGGYSLMVLAR
jgi:hypothetical protein